MPTQRAATVNGFIRDLLPAFAAGRITPAVGRVFGFAKLPAAKNYMESDAQGWQNHCAVRLINKE